MTLWRAAIVVGVLLFPGSVNARSRIAIATVPQCTGVTLSASYLAQVTPAEGPGFLLTVVNATDAAIKLARPFPTSAHWYAQAGSGRWLWRASTGSGGALVNALVEHGPLVAYPASPRSAKPIEYLTIDPHQQLQWAESVRQNPALVFRPGCERCLNPEDSQFRAVLAYAYLPASGEHVNGLLSCGLRSSLIVMPPLS